MNKVLPSVSCENWANCDYLSTRNELQKLAIVQEFMLTKGFVDHKGRVSGSIQKEYLMVNTFKSLSVYICGRADQCD